MLSKKLLAVSLVAVLSIGCFAGCGKTSSGDEEVTPTKASDYVAKKNKYGWEVPEKTLKMSVAYGQQTPLSKFKGDIKLMQDVLKKDFNVEIDAQAWETDYTERQSLMLSTQQYPDVVTMLSTDNVKNWVKAGAALDLLPEITKSAPEIKDLMGKYFVRYIDDDKKLYALPNMWGYWDAAQVAPVVRKDWYQEIGSPDVSTPEKYYEALKKMVENHPTGKDGKKTYALGMYNSTSSFINMYGGMYGFYQGWDIDKDNNLTNWAMTDKGLDMTLWLNKFQTEGLLDPDSFTQTSDQLRSKHANMRFSGYLGAWWHAPNYGHQQWAKLYDDWTEDQRYKYVNVTAEGIDHATYSAEASMGYYRTLVTKKAKDKLPEILKWFAFEMSDEGMRFVGWGVPNQEYSGWDIKDDGTWTSRDDYAESRIKDSAHWPFAEWEKTSQMVLNMTVRLMKDDQSMSAYWDVNYRPKNPTLQDLDKTMEGTCYDGAYIKEITIDPTSPLANKKQQITDTINSQWAEAIMAPDAEKCKAIFKDMQAKLKENGIDEYTEHYSKSYKKNVESWGK